MTLDSGHGTGPETEPEHAGRKETYEEKVGRLIDESLAPLLPPMISLRDYFAGQALIALLRYLTDERVAKSAYEIADAMLKARGEIKE